MTEPHRGATTGPVDFRALFDGLPTAYLVMDPDLVIVEANAAYLSLLGHTREDLVGRPVFEAFPPTPDALDEHGRNPLQTSFERARDTGEPDVMPLYQYDVADPATGQVVERFWSLVSASLRGADGEVALVLQRVEDVTDYVRQQRGRQAEVDRGRAWQERVLVVEAELVTRARQLAAALEAKDVTARRLAALNEVALDLTAARSVEELERIVVDRGLAVLGADGGAVVSRAEDGGWRVTVNAALGEHVQVRYGHVPADSPLPAVVAARAGRRVLLPTRASGMAHDPVMAAVYEDTAREGWAFLPLVVGERRLGALAVSWTGEHTTSADELDVLEAFAAQCAQTLDRLQTARAERRAALAVQRMSETLQRSLLTQPTTPDAVRTAVRYSPAASDAQVGGDWYDAFTTRAGATLLVVGDITGHDRAAAAAMGQVRNLLRGIAYNSTASPAVLLTRLDDALAGLELDTLATAVLARLEQREDDGAGAWQLRWSNAGHPPPLLLRPDGAVLVLEDKADLLLGLDPSTERGERLVELVPGSTLVMYTDGLVERRGASLDEGITRLAGVLAAEGAADPEVLCDRLLDAMSAHTGEDDTALLVMRLDQDADRDQAADPDQAAEGTGGLTR